MVLVEVGQAVVDEYIVSPVLLPYVLLLDSECALTFYSLAFCIIAITGNDLILAHFVGITVHFAVGVLDGNLLYSVAEVHEANADGDEGDANDEEGGEDGASSEYGLPGGQGLLLEF